MFSLLLAIIYLAFISLGLPDSLLGSGWPVMHIDLNVPVSYAGVITMIIAINTIISSLFSERLTSKLSTGLLTSISVGVTALALIGFSFATQFYQLCLLAIPYGLGAGAVDAAINNYVALHYKASQMSWLHSFWGVGALISPYIMSYSLTNGSSWQSGYRFVFYIQIAITVILFLSLPLWKKQATQRTIETTEKKKPIGISSALKIRGVKPLLLAFFAYCALEQTGMIWASSYLAQYRGISTEKAAMFGSFVYIGITAGRVVCGFITNKIGDKTLIRIGIGVLTIGIIIIGIPMNVSTLSLIGLIIFGVGCAPVYPSIIHSTPYNFGKNNSQSIIGIQMACAYLGTTFMPPLFGLIAQYINIGLYPAYLLIFSILLIIMSEVVNKLTKHSDI